jgi:alanine racemase
MQHRTWIEIDERALTRNIENLTSLLTEGARFCAVVKANAYGHGLKEVAQIASRAGVSAFAVDTVQDAIKLRKMLPSALILTLGYVMNHQLHEAVQYDIDVTVYNKETIQKLEEAAVQLAKRARIHLKLETGTARQGVQEIDLTDYLDLIKQCEHIDLIGISTHFANIEDTNDPSFATMQYQLFCELKELIESRGHELEYAHCACSAAIVLYPDTHDQFVRAGISLYGVWSSPLVEKTARKHNIFCDLTPVLSWKTRIAQVKTYKAGTPVGYGLTEVLGRRSRIAVVPVGYYDGYDRELSSKAEVLIAGSRCKVVGRVCMNMMMIDVSHVPNCEPGQEVVLLGRSGRHAVTADELAGHAGTISYEILARINAELPRVVVSS